jgi:hypothetical protein
MAPEFTMIREDGVEVVGESGVGGVHAVGVADDGFALGEKSGDGEGHGDAVIAEAVDHGSAAAAAFDFHAVLEFLHVGSHGAEVVRRRW